MARGRSPPWRTTEMLGPRHLERHRKRPAGSRLFLRAPKASGRAGQRGSPEMGNQLRGGALPGAPQRGPSPRLLERRRKGRAQRRALPAGAWAELLDCAASRHWVAGLRRGSATRRPSQPGNAARGAPAPTSMQEFTGSLWHRVGPPPRATALLSRLLGAAGRRARLEDQLRADRGGVPGPKAGEALSGALSSASTPLRARRRARGPQTAWVHICPWISHH